MLCKAASWMRQNTKCTNIYSNTDAESKPSWSYQVVAWETPKYEQDTARV